MLGREFKMRKMITNRLRYWMYELSIKLSGHDDRDLFEKHVDRCRYLELNEMIYTL